MVAAAGLGWTVEQHPLEAVLQREYSGAGAGAAPRRQRAQRHAARARRGGRRLRAVAERGRLRVLRCDHRLGSCALDRGGRDARRRVHALMRLDREIRIGGAEGRTCSRCSASATGTMASGWLGGAPFRLACLNGMLLPIENAQRTWKARAHGARRGAARGSRRTLGIAWRYYDELEELWRAADPRRSAKGSSSGSSRGSCRCPIRYPTRAAALCATSSGYAMRSAPPTARPLTSTPSAARGGGAAGTTYVDHVQPTRRTATRTEAEARFERATEAQPLKDRALALLAEEVIADGGHADDGAAGEDQAARRLQPARSSATSRWPSSASVKQHGIITPLTLPPTATGS